MLPQWGLNMVPIVRVMSTRVVTAWKLRKAASPLPHVDRPAREVMESAKVNAPKTAAKDDALLTMRCSTAPMRRQGLHLLTDMEEPLHRVATRRPTPTTD